MTNKPAGWYRKPDDPRHHGFWDGQAWSETTEGEPSDGSSGDLDDLEDEVNIPDGDAAC
jgi:hypothetical protein